VEETDMASRDPTSLRTAPLATPTGLKSNSVKDISGAFNILPADMFALYLKTNNFHWHVSGPHFRDYHLILHE
jgi:starvation-inducible DNA-binding protein